MRVFSTNTSASTYLAFWPFSPYEIFTNFLKRGVHLDRQVF